MKGFRNSQGLPLIFFQAPRRFPIYVASISRRRRFISIICVIFLIFIIVRWYTSIPGKIPTMNQVIFMKSVENLKQNTKLFREVKKEDDERSPSVINYPNYFKEEELETLIPDYPEYLLPTEAFVRRIQQNDQNPNINIAHYLHGYIKPTEYIPPEYEEVFPKEADVPTPDFLQRDMFGPADYNIANVRKVINLYPKNKDKELDYIYELDVLPNEWKNTMNMKPDIDKNMKTPNPILMPTNPPNGLNLEQVSPTTDENTALLINTPGCKVPKFDPWDPSVSDIIELRDPYECPGPPLLVRTSEFGTLTLNETVLETYYNVSRSDMRCWSYPILRLRETPGRFREVNFGMGNYSYIIFNTPMNDDYVGITCNNRNIRIFEHIFPIVRLKDEVEKERNLRAPPIPRLNVILIGIDSVSKLNFLRHFLRTHKFLHETMSPFEMNGYIKVGDNTFPNLVPLLTGRFVNYYWNETLMNTKFFDNLDFIWKDYAKKGYRTLYSEDTPYSGTFQYFKRGFYNPPTDYYLRPVSLAAEYSRVKNQSKEHCMNSQMEMEWMYDYLRDFIKEMKHRPHFSFTMTSRLTHDDINLAGAADLPTVNLLEDLWNNGALNNSFLVLFSDHGLRYGPIRNTYIGKLEERMPLMYLHFPQWFLDQYPLFAKNLRINQDRIVTLLDIHATLLNLLNLTMTWKDIYPLSLGTSLLQEIPQERTCESAFIEHHWCPCETYEKVSIGNSAVINASRAMVDDINSKLEAFHGQCAILDIYEILDARLGRANELVLKYDLILNKTIVLGNEVEPIGNYLITLVTQPGNAVFEGTIRHNPFDGTYTVLGISRINMYGTQSWCIDSQKMKLFCFCKEQLQ